MIYNQIQKGEIGTPFGRLAAGLALLLTAVVLLWLNEGAMDVAKITRASLALSADKVEDTGNRRLVSITGRLSTADEIGDPQYLKPGHYLKLVRKVQRFRKVWAYDPKLVKVWQAPSARIGAYTIDPQMIELPAPEALRLSPDKAALSRGDRLHGKYYIFSGYGTPKKPRSGDLLVSFAAVAGSLEVTAFGKKQDDMLAPYVTVEYKFYKIFKGDRDQALAQMPAQHTARLWAFRLTGLLLMWLGFSFFSLPVQLFGRRLTQFSQASLTVMLAAAGSLLVILLSVYSISLLVVFGLALAGYFIYLYLKGRQ